MKVNCIFAIVSIMLTQSVIASPFPNPTAIDNKICAIAGKDIRESFCKSEFTAQSAAQIFCSQLEGQDKQNCIEGVRLSCDDCNCASCMSFGSCVSKWCRTGTN
jgi:hypothetical protein